MDIPNLKDLLWSLFTNADERTEYEADPEGYLAEHGCDGVTPEQINEAIPFVYEEISAGTERTTTINTGGNTVSQGGPTHGGGTTTAPAPAPPPPPPPPPPDMPPMEAVTSTINYYTNNYVTENNSYLDDRDEVVNVDNSINQTLIGENINQALDVDNTTQVGDGNVAGGEGGIDAPVNTGTFTGVQNDDGTVEDVAAVGGDNTGFVQGDVNDSANVLGNENQVAGVGEANAAVTNFGDGANTAGGNQDDATAIGGDNSGFAAGNANAGDSLQVGFGGGDNTAVGDSEGVAFGEGAEANVVDVDTKGGDANVATDGSEANQDNSLDQSTDVAVAVGIGGDAAAAVGDPALAQNVGDPTGGDPTGDPTAREAIRLTGETVRSEDIPADDAAPILGAITEELPAE